uniref:Peptidase C13, legumain asparaginyl peptidase n=1 Tax=Geobacter sp. (strain M21) TaxID=443144 RepID=C6E545_GEOSM
MVVFSIMESEERREIGGEEGAAAEEKGRETSPGPGAAPSAEGGSKGPLFRLLSDLKGGARLSLLLRSDLERLDATSARLVLLVLTDLALNLVCSFLLVGTGGYFSYSSIPGFFFHLPLLLLLGLAAGRLLSRDWAAPAVAAALIALSIPIEFCHALLEAVVQLRHFERLQGYLTAPHYYRFYLWWGAAALFFLYRIDPARGVRRLRLPLLFAVLVLLPLYYFPRGDLWASSAQESESGELNLTDEVLAAQAKLLDGELAALKPGRPGVTDLYFVGFAGDASQDVFLKELNYAKGLFDRRFGTSGRSVLLANNPQSATTLPFAGVGNLERALVRVGEAMNRDEDLLFLYLSSHGSRDHELAVNNPPLELKQLTPELLKRELARAGIKWKVIVVSACFSGGFVPPLQDDGTLVMTAADATRESFGCGFGEDFTWFGEAFLQGALSKEFSFTAAFDRARETIGKWEEERGETPSNPQIWVGKGIEAKLGLLEKALKEGKSKKP